MAEKLLLIDGNNIMNRAYYGVPPLTNSKGEPTGAIYGFMNILYKYLSDINPKYVGVAFDRKEPTFRHKMFDAYKGTRKPAPDDFRAQMPVIREVLSASGIAVLDKAGYEADDIIGTFSRLGEEAGMEVVILSGDRDLFQLITPKVIQYIPRTSKGVTTTDIYTTETMMEVYGVTPREFIDVKALQGDSSDNIPGVPGVGEKTAQALIAQYHSLEEIRAHIEDVKPTRAKNAIDANFDLAILSRDLARIVLDVPMEEGFDNLMIGDVYTKEAYEIFARLELKKLMKKFSFEGGETAVQMSPSSEARVQTSEKKVQLKPAQIKVATGMDLTEVDGFFDELSKCERVAIALEEIFGETHLIATGDGQVVYDIKIAWMVSEEYLKEKIESLSVKVLSLGLQEILRTFDLNMSDRYVDLEIAAYLLNPLASTYNYDDIARDFLGDMVLRPKAEIFDKKKMPEEGSSTVQDFIAHQVQVIFEAESEIMSRLENAGMMKLFSEVEMPTAWRLRDMEKAGVRVNKDELAAYGDMLTAEIDRLEAEIYSLAGEEFNINSPKQLGAILFEKMGLPGGKKTKTGYSTAADVLEKLRGDSAIVSKILEYRTYSKLRSTYAEGLGAYIQADGRIHGHFQQTVTATGRLSSTEPNLQNIPVREAIGREIRKVFVPAEGCVFIDADYSQIELRVLAHLSGDERLIEAYSSSEDIHRLTASEVFHVPIDEVTAEQRRAAKAVNFGIVYGESAFGLSEGLGISRKEANDYIAGYFETYPGVKKFLDKQVLDAKNNGFVTTLYGRRRPVPELKSGKFMQRQFGERIAMNSPIQGTAADIMKMAMLRVCEALEERYGSDARPRVVLQVHDELLLEVPQGMEEEVRELLAKAMMQAADLRVPLEVSVEIGNSWFETK